MDSERFCCCVCLELLKDPVTIPCGHSYCRNCIKKHWDEEDQKGIHSCPVCRKRFVPRPVLEKNIMLAQLVEDLKKSELQADDCYAGAGDVACDVCTGRKLKATKSCLVCLVSYCQKHLQPHYDVAPFKKHKLVEPSEKLKERFSSCDDEVMKIFEKASAAAERAERQKEAEASRQLILQRIQDRQKDVELLQQEVEAITRSADKTVEDSEKIFTELIRLLQKRSSDVKQQIRSQQRTEVSRVKELLEKLEQEIIELKRRDGELEMLLRTEDHSQFLLSYSSLSALSESTHPPSIHIRPLRYFQDVAAAVSELGGQLRDLLAEKWTNIPAAVTDVDVLLAQPEPEPESRAAFFRHAKDITLDPNTAHTHLFLSEGNRKATTTRHQQPYSGHPHRFSVFVQVLSRDTLTGRCYWEVERRGGVHVAVAYKDIRRTGSDECGFGYNDKSWSLHCDTNKYTFCHNNVERPVSGPPSCRVGVYLDHRAGLLSFYSVSDTMTLLHRVQTTFTQPLYAGLRLADYGVTAEFKCEE